MAKKEEAAAEAPAEGGGGKKKLLIIVAAVLGVLLVAGGVVLYLLMTPHGDEKQAKEEEVAAKEEHPPIYERLDTFTVNLANQESFLQVEVQLKVASPEVQAKVKSHLPEVRDAMLRLLSSKGPEDLAGPEGKDKLAEEIQAQVNEILGVKEAEKGVKGVLFTSFIIQH